MWINMTWKQPEYFIDKYGDSDIDYNCFDIEHKLLDSATTDENGEIWIHINDIIKIFDNYSYSDSFYEEEI